VAAEDKLTSDDRTTTEDGATQRSVESARSNGLAWLWAGLLVAPVAFLFNLQTNYTLTQKLCPGGRMVFLHIMSLFFLLVTTAGGLIAWRNRERAGRARPNEAGDKTARNRFLGTVGLMMSVLSFLLIIAQWIPQFIFNPCQR
jgi:Ca2+/H+ antiporter